MPTTLDIDGWSTQLRKGLAELCVLAAVERLGEAYGYQLVQFLTDHDGLALTESTVYPLLARLAREGQLSVNSQPSPTGPPVLQTLSSVHLLRKNFLGRRNANIFIAIASWGFDSGKTTTNPSSR